MAEITSHEIISLLKENRTVRRFRQNERIPMEQIAEYAAAAQLCASGRNLQPLKYCLITNEDACAEIFPLLKWAGYLTDWDGPVEGERPVAYIIQCLDTSLTTSLLCDDGLQLEAITLAACADGVNSCIIKSFNIPLIKKVLELPEYLEPRYVVAMGRPAEEVRIEPMKDGDVKYWRDKDDIFHVPKRSLNELISLKK